MSDLAKWLSEQYDQAERAAKAATPGPWSFSGDEPRTPTAEGGFTIDADSVVDTPGLPWGSVHPGDVVGTGYNVPSGVFRRADAVHIAAHDPAWRLSDIAIKRQVVDLHGAAGHGCSMFWFDTGGEACLTLLLLAAEFAGRPGYRDEWKP